MKSSVLNLAKSGLAIIILGAVVACNHGTTDTKTTVAATPEKAEIVYVNTDTLLSKYEYSKDMVKRLQAKGDAAKEDLQSKGAAFQRQVDYFKKIIKTI